MKAFTWAMAAALAVLAPAAPALAGKDLFTKRQTGAGFPACSASPWLRRSCALHWPPVCVNFGRP